MEKESTDWLILVLSVEGKISYLEEVLMLTKGMVNGMSEKPWRLRRVSGSDEACVSGD